MQFPSLSHSSGFPIKKKPLKEGKGKKISNKLNYFNSCNILTKNTHYQEIPASWMQNIKKRGVVQKLFHITVYKENFGFTTDIRTTVMLIC